MICNKKGNIEKGYLRRALRVWMVGIILGILLLFLTAFMMIYGNTIYSPAVIYRVLGGEVVEGASFAIMTLRLPRMLTGLLAGLAFGMAGATFQGLLRNSLASPDMIGLTSGSGAAAVFCILVLKISGSMVSWAALAGGILVAGLIYIFSMGKGFSHTRLILVGLGMQAMLQALISYLLLIASQYDVASALRWLSGSLNGVKMADVPGLALVVCIGGMGLLFLDPGMQILRMGEEYPITLGVKSHLIRGGAILMALILTARATSVTGPIASVAFLSGPIASRMVGHGRTNLVAAGLVGAILVLGGDLVGQFFLPARYPVGVVTGILGAPYLLFLLMRMNKKGEDV